MKKKGLYLWVIVAVLIMSISFVYLRFSMKKSVSVKDEDRICVRFDTEVLTQALEAKAVEWGTVETDWSMKFWEDEAATMTIISKANQKFSKIFLADSAAYKISQDFPHLFSFQVDEVGSCLFTMRREQGDEGYVVLPTWLLVELLENEILMFSK